MKRNLLILISILLFAGILYGQPPQAKLFGTVYSEDGKPLVGANITLYIIEMEGEISISPLQKIESDSQGKYSFKFPLKDKKTFYRIGALTKESRTGTNPLRFEPGQTEIKVDLTFPKIIIGAKKLIITKTVLLFELFEEFVRVTNALYLENNSGSIIDTRQQPLQVQLPDKAQNPNFERKYDEFNIAFKDGKASYEMFVPPGKHTLYYNYLLPMSGSKFEFTSDLAPASDKLELIYNYKDMDVSFKDGVGDFKERAIKTEKNHKQQKLSTLSVKLKTDDNQVTVVLKKLVMEQKKLFYPASILLIVLLSGLFWYLKSRTKTD